MARSKSGMSRRRTLIRQRQKRQQRRAKIRIAELMKKSDKTA